MKQHHKEIIKFISQPIWKPIKCVLWEIADIFKFVYSNIVGEDGGDAWMMFWILLGIIVMIFWFTFLIAEVLLWKTLTCIAVKSYIAFYYFRDYKKRKRKE